MIRFKETQNAADCCGCRACEQRCPSGAISMAEDREGFIYPYVNLDTCSDCGICDQVCPMKHLPERKRPLEALAVQLSDTDILKKSSSGGVFRLLSDNMINRGGYVAGCVWDERMRAVFQCAVFTDETERMQGSKYVSSDTLDIYKHIEELLKQEKTVMFFGAPCQNAGLFRYLGGPDKCLYMVDFLCHGMPSERMFQAYYTGLRKAAGKGQIHSFSFRDKALKGWGMVVGYDSEKNGKTRHRYQMGDVSSYLYGYSKGLFNRYSCYSCPFIGAERFTDFTMADYWGIQRIHPEFEWRKGVSLLLINSEKAKHFWYSIDAPAKTCASTIAAMSRENGSLCESTVRNEEIPAIRHVIYKELEEQGYPAIKKKYLRPKRLYLQKGKQLLWWFLNRRAK